MRHDISEKILKKQSVVDLARMEIQDHEMGEIMEHLYQDTPQLTRLDLDYNHLSDEGAKILSQHLPKFNVLTKLNLQFNHIGREGVIALLTCQKRLPHLEILLHGNQIARVNEINNIEQQVARGPK